jgi:hypothetical protein
MGQDSAGKSARPVLFAILPGRIETDHSLRKQEVFARKQGRFAANLRLGLGKVIVG